MELIINSPKHGDKIVLLDDADYELVKEYKWYPQKGRNTFHAYTSKYDPSIKNSKGMSMHSLIMGELGIDHINHNGLDNRRSNLRSATQMQNTWNMSVKCTNQYGLKGVTFDKQKNAYATHITVAYKHIFLGYFASLIDASNAYNEAAKNYYKEFAQLNYISPERENELRRLDITTFKPRGKNKTKYRGVSLSYDKYMARKTYKGKTYFIGLFDTDVEASIAYNNFNVKEQYEKDYRGITPNP